MSVRAEGPLAAALALALFPLQGALDARRAQAPDLVAALPPPRLLTILAFGHRGALADLLEIRATNDLMRSLQGRSRLDRDRLVALYDGVLALDPQDADAYWRAAVLLYSVADRPDSARDLLLRGLEAVDPRSERRWRLIYELAAQRLLQAVDRPAAERDAEARAAGALLASTAGLPGAPPILATIGEGLRARGLSRVDALEHEAVDWEQRAEGASEPALRRRYALRAREARAAQARERVQAAVDAWVKARGAPPPDLAALRIDVADPLGVGLRLEGDRVVAPGVDAARLERSLVGQFQAWRVAHPGATPSLEDLGVRDVPPWLTVEVHDEGVVVRPRVSSP